MKSLTSTLLFAAPIVVQAAYAGESAVVTLKISGMACPRCASGVCNALVKVEGVESATVDLEKALAVVRFDPSKTSTSRLIAAVSAFGGARHRFTARWRPRKSRKRRPQRRRRAPRAAPLPEHSRKIIQP